MFKNHAGKVTIGFISQKNIQTSKGVWSFLSGSFTSEDLKFMQDNIDEQGRFRFKITTRKPYDNPKAPTHDMEHDTWKPNVAKVEKKDDFGF